MYCFLLFKKWYGSKNDFFKKSKEKILHGDLKSREKRQENFTTKKLR